MKLRTSLTLLFLSLTFSAEVLQANPAAVTNKLGLDLYRLESGKKPGNFLISPYSIQTALSMVLEGAGGKTRAEMERVLHPGMKGGAAADGFTALRKELEAAAAKSQKAAVDDKKEGANYQPVELRIANRLFGSDEFPLRPEFLSLMETRWQAPMETLAFRKKPEAARKHINDWVEKQTAQRITDLLPSGSVNEDSRLVLVNALYFKAAWAEEFYGKNTKPLPFHAGGKSPVNVPTMYQREYFGYTREATFSAVTLPYTGYQTQFLIILPHAKDGLAEVEKKLTAADFVRLAKIERPANRGEIDLYLPKFKIESFALPLTESLKALGLKSAFDEPAGSADFSRMLAGPAPQRYGMSGVYHKTFLSLDEKGTEAAAATAVMMFGASAAKKPDPVEFRVDHPFLFAIQHRDSGVCLFLGRVTDPR